MSSAGSKSSLQGTSKANDDQETRTNLEDADDERASKSTMDQTKKPEGPLEEPVEKNNDEIPVCLAFLPRIKVHPKICFKARGQKKGVLYNLIGNDRRFYHLTSRTVALIPLLISAHLLLFLLLI